MSRRDLAPAVWAGTLSALFLCAAAAAGLTLLGVALEDPGEAIFEGLTMLLAAGIMTWMVFWMARQSRNTRAALESGLQQASQSGKRGLFFLAFIAVLREGVEMALFLTAAIFASNTRQALPGALLGLGSAVLLGAAVFATSLRLDLRKFFLVTGTLLVLFAAGLVARGVGELVEVGWLPALREQLWNLGGWVSGDSLLGQILGTLLGYAPSPSLMQVLTYTAFLGAVATGLGVSRMKRKREISISPQPGWERGKVGGTTGQDH